MPANSLSAAQLLPVHAAAASVRDGHRGGEVHCGARPARPQQQGALKSACCSIKSLSALWNHLSVCCNHSDSCATP